MDEAGERSVERFVAAGAARWSWWASRGPVRRGRDRPRRPRGPRRRRHAGAAELRRARVGADLGAPRGHRDVRRAGGQHPAGSAAERAGRDTGCPVGLGWAGSSDPAARLGDVPARTSTRPRGGATRATSRATGRRRGRGRAGGPLAPVGRAVSAGWLLLARGAGGAARAVGRQAATARLDPAHRRDGVGLAVLGLAVVVGMGVWFSGGGPVGRAVDDLLRGAVGTAAAALPVLLAAAGVHLLRQLPRPEERGRVGIGWVALALAVTGLFHLGGGAPAGPARSGAGGLVGSWAAGPLQRGVGTALAVLLLVLLGTFGLLVVTKTPVNRVPHRIREVRDRLLRRPPPVDEAAPEEALEPPTEEIPPVRLRRPSRRRQGSLADPDPYDVDARRPGGRRAGGRGGRAEAAPPPGGAQAPAGAGAGGAGHPAGAARAVRTDRLHAARLHAAGRRHPAEGEDEGQRHGHRRAAAGLRGVRGGRGGHRLHPRPDGHPLRGGARPGGQGRADHPAVPQHRVRGEERGRPDPQPDPGQERGRGGDPQHRPRARQPRRRAAQLHRDPRPAPDDRRAGQGHRGRLRGGQPGQDAAHPHRRRHRRRQVQLHQHADRVDPGPGHPGRGADGADRSQAGRADRRTRASRTWSRRSSPTRRRPPTRCSGWSARWTCATRTSPPAGSGTSTTSTARSAAARSPPRRAASGSTGRTRTCW